MSGRIDASNWTLRETAHINASSSGWFGYVHECVEEPRITRHLKCIRKTRTTEITWRVDGVEVAGFTTALAAVGAYLPTQRCKTCNRKLDVPCGAGPCQ